MGRLSQERLQLNGETYEEPPSHNGTQKSKYIDRYIWGANIADILIQQMIMLYKHATKQLMEKMKKRMKESGKKKKNLKRKRKSYIHYRILFDHQMHFFSIQIQSIHSKINGTTNRNLDHNYLSRNL